MKAKAVVVSENGDRWRHADCSACGCPLAGAPTATTRAWTVQIASDLVEQGKARYGPPRERGYVFPVRHAARLRPSAGPFPGIEGGLTTRSDFYATCPECGLGQGVIVGQLRGQRPTSTQNDLIATDPDAYHRGQRMFGANIARALRDLKDSRRTRP